MTDDSGQWSWQRFSRRCRDDAATVMQALPATPEDLYALGLTELRLRLALYCVTRELRVAHWVDGRLVRGASLEETD